MENILKKPLPHIVPEKEGYCCGCWNLIYNAETGNIQAICNECATAFDIIFDITILRRPVSQDRNIKE